MTKIHPRIHLLPTVIPVAIGAAIGGLITIQRNFTFYTILVWNALILIGAGIHSVTPILFKIPHVLYGSQVVTGLGCGLTFCCTTMIISLTVEFQDHTIGQGLVAQARIVGGIIGVVMSTAIFGNHISSLIDILTPQQMSTLHRNTGYISQLSPAQQVAKHPPSIQECKDQLEAAMLTGPQTLNASWEMANLSHSSKRLQSSMSTERGERTARQTGRISS
nr:hypothetical protein CFP56_04557 [Quercus suber]